MKVKVILPLPLQRFTGGRAEVQLEGAASLEELVKALDLAYPGIKSRLADEETGELLPYVHYVVNGQSRRPKEKGGLQDGDVVTVIPAVYGG